jgi:hypothetical protein
MTDGVGMSGRDAEPCFRDLRRFGVEGSGLEFEPAVLLHTVSVGLEELPIDPHPAAVLKTGRELVPRQDQ